MNGIQICKAGPGDLPRMQQIARRTIDQCYRGFLGDESVDWYINSGEADKELQKHMENCDLLLKDEEIAAFTIYFEDLIHLMMVDVSLHRRGLGSQLLAHSERQLWDLGCSTIRLETFKGNQQAIDFYLKNGWIITAEEKDKDTTLLGFSLRRREPSRSADPHKSSWLCPGESP